VSAKCQQELTGTCASWSTETAVGSGAGLCGRALDAVAFSGALPERDPIRWREIPSDVLRSAIVDLVGRAISLVTIAAVGGVALLVALGGSIPAWVGGLIALGAAITVFVARRQVRKLRAAIAERDETIAVLQPLADSVPQLEEDVATLEWAASRHQAYGFHVVEMLELLQSTLAGHTSGVTMTDFITRGVLEPARDMLGESAPEGTRLSILYPKDDCLEMAFSSGHRLDSQRRYRMPIADSLSRVALEEGVLQHWDDVTTDDRFKPHESATRPFQSMVSVPIRVGDDVHAVFNVIAANASAFDPAEIAYIAALGSIVEVALGLFVKESLDAAQGRSE
jgi:hypothetical protein